MDALEDYMNPNPKKTKNALFRHNLDKKEIGTYLLTGNRALFLALFVWGQVICFRNIYWCSEAPNFQSAVFFIHVAFGYLYVGIPLLFFVVGCTCFGWLFVGKSCSKGAFKVKKAVKKKRSMVIKGAKKEKFRSSSSLSHNCGACNAIYEEREKIVKLSCTSKHHLHEGCLEKWVIDGNKSCPICLEEVGVKKRRQSRYGTTTVVSTSGLENYCSNILENPQLGTLIVS